MRRLAILALVLALATAASAAPGDGPHGPRGRGPMHGPMGGPGPMDRNLFPPDLILSNQIALGVTDEQVAAIKTEIGATHDKSLGYQTDLGRVTEQLHAVIAGAKVDLATALPLASQAMDLEKQIKTAHLTLMIRVKNLLTPEQQEKARALRPQRPDGPPEAN